MCCKFLQQGDRDLTDIKGLSNFKYVAHDDKYVVGYATSHLFAMQIKDQYERLFALRFPKERTRVPGKGKFGERGSCHIFLHD